MPGHFDFGHDGDVAFCGVLDDFFGVLLGVEASVGFVSYSAGEYLSMVLLRVDPTEVSFGYFLISKRQPWSSVRCQWKTLSLWSARVSMYFLIASLGMKCRPVSSMEPRQENLGTSSMMTEGTTSF